MEPIVETYRKVLNLFQDKDRFCVGYYQKDKNGNECPWREGYSFCALGAMQYFAADHMPHRAVCCLQRVSEHLFGGICIQHINDGPDGREKVMEALRFAIQLWDGCEPTEEELGMSVNDLLEKRNAART